MVRYPFKLSSETIDEFRSCSKETSLEEGGDLSPFKALA